MSKKPAKKAKPTPEYDSERETRVLLEDVGSDVKKIAEQVASNSEKLKKLDNIEQDVTVLKADMGDVKKVVHEHSKDLKEVKSELNSVKMAVMDNSHGIKQNASKIDNLTNKADRIEKKLDTVTTGHEQRLHKLETIR